MVKSYWRQILWKSAKFLSEYGESHGGTCPISSLVIDSSIDPGLYDVNEYEDKVYLEVIDVEFKLPIIKKTVCHKDAMC